MLLVRSSPEKLISSRKFSHVRDRVFSFLSTVNLRCRCAYIRRHWTYPLQIPTRAVDQVYIVALIRYVDRGLCWKKFPVFFLLYYQSSTKWNPSSTSLQLEALNRHYVMPNPQRILHLSNQTIARRVDNCGIACLSNGTFTFIEAWPGLFLWIFPKFSPPTFFFLSSVMPRQETSALVFRVLHCQLKSNHEPITFLLPSFFLTPDFHKLNV